MRKYGVLTLKESNDSFIVVWYDNGASFTRFDIIRDLSEYKLIDTTNCDAAYLGQKGKISSYGDEKLVSSVWSAINTNATASIKMEQETSIAEGKIRVIQSKESEELGLRWYQVLDFGEIVEEYFETPEVILIFDDYDKKNTSEYRPINMSMYQNYGELGVKVTDSSSAEYYSEEYLRAYYPIEHMDDYDLYVVDSMVTAVSRLETFVKAETKVKSVDLETTGLGWNALGDDVLVGVVLSWNENEGTYFPFRQENFDYNLPISFLTKILEAINNQPADVKIIGHNAKVEMQGFKKEGRSFVGNSEYARKWNPNCVEDAPQLPALRIDGDSMLLSILVNPEFYKGAHALKTLAGKYRQRFFLELSDVFKDKRNIKFNVLPKELVKLYACMDTANTIYIWNALLKELPEDEIGILELETRMIPITAEMEFFGMRTNREYLLKMIQNEEYVVDMLAKMFKEIHKLSANINSNDVRRDIFYNKLRAPIKVRTKTGAPATSSLALKAIVDSGKRKLSSSEEVANDIVDLNENVVVKGKDLSGNKYPSLVILQAYAKHFKELGALRRIERKSRKDRVFFSLNQAGAATGRATSDAHQYSDAMKKAIIADGDAFNLWSADFKQVELRILAYVAGQQDLIEMESDPDVDVHRAILAILKNKPIWDISADERKEGKSTNFGVVYRMSAKGLARKNKGVDCSDKDVIQAQESITSFYNGLPKIKAQSMRNEYEAKTYGVIVNEFGRRRYFKQLLDPECPEDRAAALLRAANNFPIQSFGADLLKICQCNLRDYIKAKGWDKLVEVDGLMMPMVRLMLPIHDEVLVSSHKSIPLEEIITMFKVCMEVNIAGAPPFFSAPAKVNCWYDGKLDKYEIDLRFRDKVVETYAKKGKKLLHAYSYDESLTWEEGEAFTQKCHEYRDKIHEQFGKDVRVEDKKKEILDIIGEDIFKVVKHYTLNSDTTLALTRLMDEDFDWYLTDLSDYRNERLASYMDDLIKRYKTVDEVAAHVQHPELTHTLISVKINKDEHFEHREAIREAVKRYMEGYESITALEEVSEDKEYIRSFEDLEKFMEFDENGELIESEGIEEEEEEEFYVADIQDHKNYRRSYCSCLLQEIIVDLSDFDNNKAVAEEINQAIGRLHSDKELYTVLYLRHGKLLQSNIKIAHIPEAIDSIIEYWKNKEGSDSDEQGDLRARESV
ncbi:MAG: hypothetical protein IJE43_19235 [Alphaproteobacteria bacterium]|nr:hypothetical protein [Alphaproteobacteria bacterium]